MATVVIDLDGVCYEWERTARYMLRTYRGQTHLTQESSGWDSIQEAVSKADWEWLWSEGVGRGLFRYGHMVKDARRGLELLQTRRHKLVICTHRPNSAVNDTLDWVSYYFKGITLSGVHLFTAGESKARVKGDFLIDDKPRNCDDWNASGRDAILFDRPWNRDWVDCPRACVQEYPHTYRAMGWADVVQTLDGIV